MAIFWSPKLKAEAIPLVALGGGNRTIAIPSMRDRLKTYLPLRALLWCQGFALQTGISMVSICRHTRRLRRLASHHKQMWLAPLYAAIIIPTFSCRDNGTAPFYNRFTPMLVLKKGCL